MTATWKTASSMKPSWLGGERRKAPLMEVLASHDQRSYAPLGRLLQSRTSKSCARLSSSSNVTACVTDLGWDPSSKKPALSSGWARRKDSFVASWTVATA